MTIGLLGRKCGMTRLYTENGTVPVTVVEAMPNRVVQVKSIEKDGYRALQVVTGKRPTRLNKALEGQFVAAGVEAGSRLQEIRLNAEELLEIKVGDQLTVELFQVGQKVNIRGLTKGKGTAGTVKRHGFRTQDATHGNSLSHRAPGSVGQNQSPGRVFKGKKMAGHLGNVFRSTLNQEIIKIDAQRNLLLIKGAIPGAPGGAVVVFLSGSKKEKVGG